MGNHLCQGCGVVWAEDELTTPVKHLTMRVEPGEIMPSGECPIGECRALCHPVEV